MQWPPILLLTWLSTLPAEASSSELSVRNLPGHTSEETILEIRRRLDLVARNSKSNVLFDNSTSLDSALIDKTLFEHQNDSKTGAAALSAGVQISCAKCYLKGTARAKLTVNGTFNSTRVYNEAKTEAKAAFRQITQYVHNVTDALVGDITDIPYKLDHLPPPQINLNVDLEFPGYELEVEFDHAELYVALGTVISSGLTYTLPLYSSKELGIELGPGFLLGAVFSLDLVLSAESDVKINSGFHIKLDKKALMKIALFAKESSNLQIHGGKFEFLPVTVEGGSTVLRALLRLQLRAGFSLPLMDSTVEQLRAAAGLEARVYANVADLVTNVTAGSRESCALEVVQGYKLAVGAAAGASVALLGNTYGPTPATEIPVYYTTLAAACVTSVELETASASAVPGLARRSDPRYYTTTTVTGVTYQAGACMSRSIVNCPASLQTVSRNVVTKTLTATVPSGSKADWSAPAVTAFAAEAFGDGSLPLKGVSGRPSSYVPTTSSTASSAASSTAPLALSDDEQGGWTGDAGKVIGVSVGVGASVLVALVGVSM
ncbi:hypothetical protein J3458_022150 [Metarhizium acridum]|uniref:GPI anchored protein n=1 Tax=Metarhizium acridum (strain CQMa 102) TaxID=655827 RepID=E9DZ75_METAQ|nr:uncharacterized protein MAC_02923 [Metarhizium acridum CQMa 102]EFY91037.1 hypothetical protein MAC_02923 [Metarhizium acridum CQMa 102]KAG8405498.1 hypothetical protein J3458_022150 [Metarhizium acridum]